MASLGDLMVRVGGDPSGFRTAMQQASSDADVFAQKIVTSVEQSSTLFDGYGRTVRSSMETAKQSTDQMTQATDRQTESVRKLGAAHHGAITEIQATSGALRVLESSGGIRAAERFLTLIPGLGSALQVAFPIVGAIALGEQLGRMFEKYDPLIQATKKLEQANKDLDRSYEELGKRFETLAIEQATLESGKAAGFRLAGFYSKLSMEQDKTRMDEITREIGEKQAKLQSGQAGSILPGAIGMFFTQRSEAALKAEIAALQKEQENLQQKSKVDQLAGSNDSLKQSRELGKDAKEAQKEITRQQKEADELALAQLKSTHEMSLGQVIHYWQLRLTAESSNAERSREIQITLGNLIQEQGKAFEHIGERSVAATERAAKEAEKVQAFLENMALESEQLINKMTDDAAKLQTRMNEISAKGAGESNAAASEMQKLQAQRSYGLELGHTLTQEVAYMRQLAVLEDEREQAKIAALQSEMAITDAAGEQVKAAELQNQITAAQAAASARRYESETKVLETIKAQSLAGKLASDIKGLSSSIGGGLASGIMGGGRNSGIGQEIERSLKNVGQQILGQTFKAAIDKLVIATGLNTVAQHIGHAIMTSHAGVMLTHAGVMLMHAGVVIANTIVTALNTIWTAILTAVETVKAFLGFADGGIPPVGVPSMVGERGPELFVPHQLGTIIPNHKLGGSGGGGAQISGVSGGDTHVWHINSPNPRDTVRQISSFMKSAGGPKFAAASR